MTTIMGGLRGWGLGLGQQKTPRASRLGLGVRFFWCLSRLCTTSGPATRAGKGKPEVIKRCATHDRIMARAFEGRKPIAAANLKDFAMEGWHALRPGRRAWRAR